MDWTRAIPNREQRLEHDVQEHRHILGDLSVLHIRRQHFRLLRVQGVEDRRVATEVRVQRAHRCGISRHVCVAHLEEGVAQLGFRRGGGCIQR